VVNEPFSLSLTFTYDGAGNRTQVQDSKGGVATSTYDNANNLTSRQFSDGTTPLRADFTYDGNNQLSSITRYSNLAGTTTIGSTSYSYDADNRLSTLQHRNGAGSLYSNYTYAYDPGSRLQSETLNGTTQTFTYDAAGELIGDGTNSWSYDSTGNRNSTGYNTTTGNQLQQAPLSDGTYSYTYDAEGNLSSKRNQSTGYTWTYSYDNANELTGVVEADNLGHTKMQAIYKYDAFGNRIEKDVDPTGGGTFTVTRFGYDGWKIMLDASGARKNAIVGLANWDVWADLDGNNNLLTRYLRGDAVDQLFARVNSGGAAWYLPDWHGSVRDMVDGSGVRQDIIAYDGFGNVTSESSASFGDRYKWTGREYDAESGLQYNRGRYYDPKVGRWISQDPLGFDAGDSNLYRYVYNCSSIVTDPSGFDGIDTTIEEKSGGRPIATASVAPKRVPLNGEVIVWKGRTGWYFQNKQRKPIDNAVEFQFSSKNFPIDPITKQIAVHWLQFVNITPYRGNNPDLGKRIKQYDYRDGSQLQFVTGEWRIDTLLPSTHQDHSPWYEKNYTYQFIPPAVGPAGQEAGHLSLIDQPGQGLAGQAWAKPYDKIVFSYKTYLMFQNKAYFQANWQAVYTRPWWFKACNVAFRNPLVPQGWNLEYFIPPKTWQYLTPESMFPRLQR
jgi:RHS repeat-associated protein